VSCRGGPAGRQPASQPALAAARTTLYYAALDDPVGVVRAMGRAVSTRRCGRPRASQAATGPAPPRSMDGWISDVNLDPTNALTGFADTANKQHNIQSRDPESLKAMGSQRRDGRAHLV
jgi:hypothetical protein